MTSNRRFILSPHRSKSQFIGIFQVRAARLRAPAGGFVEDHPLSLSGPYLLQAIFRQRLKGGRRTTRHPVVAIHPRPRRRRSMWNTEMGYLSAIEVIKKTELLRDFHFGFGLSYTSFKLTSIKVEPSPVNGPCNYEVTVRAANSPHDTEPQRDRPRRDAAGRRTPTSWPIAAGTQAQNSLTPRAQQP